MAESASSVCSFHMTYLYIPHKKIVNAPGAILFRTNLETSVVLVLLLLS